VGKASPVPSGPLRTWSTSQLEFERFHPFAVHPGSQGPHPLDLAADEFTDVDTVRFKSLAQVFNESIKELGSDCRRYFPGNLHKATALAAAIPPNCLLLRVFSHFHCRPSHGPILGKSRTERSASPRSRQKWYSYWPVPA